MRPWIKSLLLILLIGLVCVIAVGVSGLVLMDRALSSGAQAESYRSIEAEIDRLYAPAAETWPRDAAVRHAWAERLIELAWRIEMDKIADQAQARQIYARAYEQYALAAELEPFNPQYASSLAMASIGLVERTPRFPGGMRAEPLVSAQNSFEAADRLTSGDSYLRGRWAQALVWSAAKKDVSPEVALEMLDEADRVYALLVQRSPEEEKEGSSNASFWERRGEAAVTAAWRSGDSEGCRRALGRAREYFTQGGRLQGERVQLSQWVLALDPQNKPLRDPNFAELMLRERLAVLLEYSDLPGNGSSEWELCRTFERVAVYERDAEAQLQLLREAHPYCAAALESASPLYRTGMQEAVKRIDARLAAP